MASEWYITSEWGYRCNVENVYNGCLHHSGIDFGNGPISGQPLFPAAKGVISYVAYGGGVWPGCGNYVAVWHEQLGYTTLYCHLDEVWVSNGQWVDPDISLGTVGKSGMSNGIHLHFGVFPGNQINSGDFNPREFFTKYGINF